MVSNIVVSRKPTLISGFEEDSEEDAICVPYTKAAHVSIFIKITKKDIYGFMFMFFCGVALLGGIGVATLLGGRLRHLKIWHGSIVEVLGVHNVGRVAAAEKARRRVTTSLIAEAWKDSLVRQIQLGKVVGLEKDRRLVVIGLHLKVARVEDVGDAVKDSCLLQKLPDADVVEVKV